MNETKKDLPATRIFGQFRAISLERLLIDELRLTASFEELQMTAKKESFITWK